MKRSSLLFIVIFSIFDLMGRESVVISSQSKASAEEDTFTFCKMNDLQKAGFKGRIKAITENHYKFSLESNIIKKVPINNIIVTNYDQNGMIINRLEKDSLIEYTYDENYNLLSKGNNRYEYKFDKNGDILIQVTITGDSITGFSRYNIGVGDSGYLLQEYLCNSKGDTTGDIKHFYSKKCQLIRSEVLFITGGTFGDTKFSTEYTYNQQGNVEFVLLKRTFGYMELKDQLIGTRYKYDSEGNIISQLDYTGYTGKNIEKAELKIYKALDNQANCNLIEYTIVYYE